MILSMNSQDLLEGLNIVTRALSSRPAKQILEGVLISAEENRVLMTCSDGSLTIEYTNAASVQEEGQTVLPGRIFTEMIRKMPAGTVTITEQDHRSATIRCMKNRSSLAVMNPAEYPEINPMKTGSKVKIQQNKLKEMISHVVFAIATDESRQILTGSLLEVNRSEARLVALDGFRLAMYKLFQPFELPSGVDVVNAVIPGKVLSELTKILPDDDAVQDAIERASLMAREGKNNLIKMSFRDDVLKISSNAELGDVEEEMEASLNGDPVDIAFNARYITDVIRNVPDDELCMKFNSSVSPCVVVPQKGDDYLYLILPVRVFQ